MQRSLWPIFKGGMSEGERRRTCGVVDCAEERHGVRGASAPQHNRERVSAMSRQLA